MNYLQPNKNIIKKLIYDYICTNEEYAENYWNIKQCRDINHLLNIIDEYTRTYSYYISYLWIYWIMYCYYEKSENDYNNSIIQWTTKLNYGLIKICYYC